MAAPNLFFRPFLTSWMPLLLALLPGLTVACFCYDFSLPPFEDAAMLMRYADHLAAGHGIVWNPGEAPVDGATDFLFMVMVAALHKVGLSIETSVRTLTVVAHVLTLYLVYRINLRHHRTGPWLAAAATAYLGLGPGLLYIESYFGTPVFALAGLVCYKQFLHLLRGPMRPAHLWGFAFAGLTTGLIRPEGVFLAGAMCVTLLVARGWKDFQPILLRFALVFGLLGGSYFVWHWVYFGYPLPNPFYIKGGGGFYLSSLRASLFNVIQLGLPLGPIFLYGMWKQRIRPQAILLLAPIACFALVWVLMSNAMNYGMRFQYVLQPLMLVAFAPILQAISGHQPAKPWWKFAAVGLAFLALVYQFNWYSRTPRMFPDGRVTIAKALAPLAAEGYTMAVTEAGNLPYYSGWHAIDTWGLNDRHIAHAGLVDPAYLDQKPPELIMLHDTYRPILRAQRWEPKWAKMLDAMEKYIAERNYEYVACYGLSDNNNHLYFLRRDFPHFQQVRKIILQKPYWWYENGARAIDYAEEFDEMGKQK